MRFYPIKSVFPFIIFLLFLPFLTIAQELKCNVKVNAQKIRDVNTEVFKSMEKSISQFMNNRNWIDDEFKEEERIECSMLIKVTGRANQGTYKANVTIQSSRPVYKSNYSTVMLNYVDKNWKFDYTQYQSIEFNKNSYVSNLSSMLAYWAYMIIALDYDSFSPQGGTPYFEQAKTIVNNVSEDKSEAPGWKAFESNKNRYWFVENMLNSKFEKIRTLYYKYHRKGLDLMYNDVKKGRSNIFENLKSIESLARDYPNNMLFQIFFQAKSDELVGIFSEAPKSKKASAVQLLYRIDPGNANKYSKMLKNK